MPFPPPRSMGPKAVGRVPARPIVSTARANDMRMAPMRPAGMATARPMGVKPTAYKKGGPVKGKKK